MNFRFHCFLITIVILEVLLLTIPPTIGDSVSTKIVSIAVKDITFAVLNSDGTVWLWGNNDQGQLGDGTIDSNIAHGRPYPLNVDSLYGTKSIDLGFGYGVAIKRDGTVWTWGINNYGQLGNGNFEEKGIRPYPEQVKDLNNVIEISAGTLHTIALLENGTVWTWGGSMYGNLGNGKFNELPPNDTPYPTQVLNLTCITAVAAGREHSLALKNDGTVWAWGHNDLGQLGNMASNYSAIPVKVDGITNVVAISAGGKTSLALKDDGTVWAWGSNFGGALGNGDSGDITKFSSKPSQVKGLSNVIKIKSGTDCSIALKSDGTVWGWGFNFYGELGDASFKDKPIPEQIKWLNHIKDISIDFQGMALRDDNTIFVWGLDNNNLMKENSSDIRIIPFIVNKGQPPFEISNTVNPTTKITLTPVPSSSLIPAPTISPVNGSISPFPTPDMTADPPVASQSSGFDFATIATMVGLILIGCLCYLMVRK